MIHLRVLVLLLCASVGQFCSACQVDSEVGSNAISSRDAAPSVDAFALLPCSDHIDNDGDGIIDYPFDPGCESEIGQSEDDLDLPPACFNQIDDDGDGIVDFPLEPGCLFAGDGDEMDPALPPACTDGLDNDGNDEADYPEDIGCYAAGDVDESSITS